MGFEFGNALAAIADPHVRECLKKIKVAIDSKSGAVQRTIRETISQQLSTDIAEAAQDAVGQILTNSPTIGWTYNDDTPSISAAVLGGTSGAVTGSGTTNQLVKFVDGAGGVIGDSLAQDDGTSFFIFARNVSGANGGDIAQYAGNALSGNFAGGAYEQFGGTGFGAGTGGGFRQNAGQGGATGNGGAWNAGGGPAGALGGNGGVANLVGGTSFAAGTSGGNVTISGGLGGIGGSAGRVYITDLVSSFSMINSTDILTADQVFTWPDESGRVVIQPAIAQVGKVPVWISDYGLGNSHIGDDGFNVSVQPATDADFSVTTTAAADVGNGSFTLRGIDGSLYLAAANSLTALVSPGHVEIESGSATAGDTDGSPITLIPGAGFGLGVSGMVKFKDPASVFSASFATPLTANRTFTYPDATGTIGLLERAQTWTAVNTYSTQDIHNAGVSLGSSGAIDTNAVGILATANKANSAGDAILLRNSVSLTNASAVVFAVDRWSTTAAAYRRSFAVMSNNPTDASSSRVRIGFDASNYFQLACSSAGAVTMSVAGTAPTFSLPSGTSIAALAVTGATLTLGTSGGAVDFTTTSIVAAGQVPFIFDTNAARTGGVRAYKFMDNATEIISFYPANVQSLVDFKLTVAGNGIYIKEGTNATSGIATLVAGVAVVNTTKVTANSRIHLTRQTVAGTVGTSVDVTARTAGTSFTITANGSILDTSTVAWFIVEPA